MIMTDIENAAHFKYRIMPLPKQVELLPGSDIILGKPGEALCSIITAGISVDHPLLLSATEQLREHLHGLLNADIPCTSNAAVNTASILMKIDTSSAPAGIRNPEQGYMIETMTAPDGAAAVIVTGFGIPGLYYGTVTLKQCLKPDGSDGLLRLPQMKIVDWPDLETRGHFMESRYGSNLMELDDWKHVIDNMADMKMNQLVVSVYGCWCVQYDGRVSEYFYLPVKKYPKLKTPVITRFYSPAAGKWIDGGKLPPMYEKDFFGELIAYGSTHGITVFPLFNSFGHNTLIPACYPEVSAIDENGKAALTGFCTSDPNTYEMLFSIYDEIIDRYLAPNGIDSFHIGMDEVWDGIAHNKDDIYRIRSPWCKCPECSARDRKALFIDHAVRLLKHLKGRGMKNIYMYHDMLIGHGGQARGAVSGESCEDFVSALKDNDLLDVIVIDWWSYSAFKEKLMFASTRPDLGLRHTVKPWNGYYHWTILTNSVSNSRLLAEMGVSEGAEGMQSYSAWDLSYDRNHCGQADFSWNFKGAGTEEDVMRHYAWHHFGAKADRAEKAFRQMDLVVEDKIGKYDNGTPVLSRYSLMLRTLSYYFYSYVQAGKPYPRVFPGEGLSTLYPKRREILNELLQISSLAKEARSIFDDIACDTRCNMKMAGRYAYEAENYICLAEDYITLLKMMDFAESSALGGSDTGSPGAGDPVQGVADCAPQETPDMRDSIPVRMWAIDEIRKAAGERKAARLALMARFEKTKEHFLAASHMRNHSIFMQFFADLEAYLAATPMKEIKLDFKDMRHIESAAFRQLR